MNKTIEEALCHLIEDTEDGSKEDIAKIEGYIYGLLESIKK